jgi:eukaryotic-like serine/threonine-protein kinase
MGLTSGQLLAKRYQLGRCIAVGGMGEVWQAADTRLDRQVAVKVLKPEYSDDAEFRQRFHTEARMTASLNHPGIAAVHDYGEAAGDTAHPCAFLVMELVAGDPLATILLRQPRLSADRTLDILEQAAEALQAAHERGVVHRDIKPGNILITPSGRVKLTDFGIARAVDAAPLTRSGMVMGTAHYIAPEQAAGNETGPAGDVYSLAVVGYECLAGQRPFIAESAVAVAMMHIRDWPAPLPSDLPAGVRALIEATLVKDPGQRYGTGGEFGAAIAAVRAGYPLPPPGGMAGLAATAALHGPPRGLSQGALPGTPGSAPAPTAVLPPPSPQPSPERRGAGRIGFALLGVFVLLLGGFLAWDALRSPVTTSDTASRSGSAPGLAGVPPPPVASQSVQPGPGSEQDTEPGSGWTGSDEPTKDQPTPGQDDQDDQDGGTPEVLIIPTDYWGHRGSDAAVAAKVHGLIPRVVDEDGEQVDPDHRSQCRIIGLDPRAGYVPRGSTIEMTCRMGK